MGAAGVLAAREERFTRQQRLLNIEETVLVQVSLNLPGGYALYPWQELMAEASAALSAALNELGASVTAAYDGVDALGPCSLFAVTGDARSIKRLCMALEEMSPRGRLWDIDVITPAGAIDRRQMGADGRTCWVCRQAEAHVCRQSGRHLPEEVVAVAQAIARGVAT
jgi:holo-ACP synthase CitX